MTTPTTDRAVNMRGERNKARMREAEEETQTPKLKDSPKADTQENKTERVAESRAKDKSGRKRARESKTRAEWRVEEEGKRGGGRGEIEARRTRSKKEARTREENKAVWKGPPISPRKGGTDGGALGK